jgi:hypothetical protein
VNADVTTLAVALVGVTGTLVAPMLTQRLALRARQQEIDDQRQQRLEAREAERLAAAQRDLRAAYLALNASIRAFRRTMLYHLRERTEQTRAEMEQARQAFDMRHAEGQLITTHAVMEAARAVSIKLNRVYERIRLLDASAPDTAGAQRERAALRSELDGDIHEEIRNLRMAMRVELGVSEADG